MRRLSILLLMVQMGMPPGLAAQETRTVQGTISDGTDPMEDVRIEVQGRETRTFSGPDGKYAIEARVGDMLKYSYVGMRDYILRVEEGTRFANLAMIPEFTELEEVVVEGRKRKTQQQLALEYPLNKRLIRTAFGILDADAMATNIRLLDEEEINPISLCILDFLRARFAGVRVVGNCLDGGSAFLRGGIGSLTQSGGAIFDVDGMIFTETPYWLDVNNIKRMAIIAGLGYTMRYGGMGGGGVIVINTKAGSFSWDGEYDLAQRTDNYLAGPVLDAGEVQKNEASYVQAFAEATSLEEALAVHAAFSPRYRSVPYYLLEAYRTLSGHAGGQEVADALIGEGWRYFEKDASLLKALAYYYQEQKRHGPALECYKKVFHLRPSYAQSYLDLARAYRDEGMIKQAASIYSRYKYLLDAGLIAASEDFSKLMQHESDNLLVLHGREIGISTGKIESDPFVQNTTRIVVEWSHTEAEFELQFVNPRGQYYTWEHTYAQNEARILDEKMKGYSIEEQILDNSLPGDWEVNLRYLGNKSLTPTYMKVTVYTHYNTPRQDKTVRVYRLTLKEVNQKLLGINEGATVVLN